MREIKAMLAFVCLCCGLLPGVSGAAETPPFPVQDAPWRTDFSRHTVPLDEIVSGGPPRDGIPPIDEPNFVNPAKRMPGSVTESRLSPSAAVKRRRRTRCKFSSGTRSSTTRSATSRSPSPSVRCATVPWRSSAVWDRGCWISERQAACGTVTWSCGTGKRSRGGSS